MKSLGIILAILILSFTLVSAGGTIYGYVYKGFAGGPPLPGASVHIWLELGWSRTVQTNQNGYYRVDVPYNDTYKTEAWKWIMGDYWYAGVYEVIIFENNVQQDFYLNETGDNKISSDGEFEGCKVMKY